MGSVDRVQLHALSPENIQSRRAGPEGPGTIGLGNLGTIGLGSRPGRDTASAETGTQASDRRTQKKGRALPAASETEESKEATDRRTQEEWQALRAASPQPLFPVSSAAQPDRAILKTVTLEGAAAQSFLGLWRAQAMDCDRTNFPLCHDPFFAVSFFAGQQLLLEVSLCWWCQDVRFSMGSEETGCDFVVGTAEARALRRMLKGYFPDVSNWEDRVLPSNVQ